jgi:hypothetical protein
MSALGQQKDSDFLKPQKFMHQKPKIRTSIQMSSQSPNGKTNVGRKNREHSTV